MLGISGYDMLLVFHNNPCSFSLIIVNFLGLNFAVNLLRFFCKQITVSLSFISDSLVFYLLSYCSLF